MRSIDSKIASASSRSSEEQEQEQEQEQENEQQTKKSTNKNKLPPLSKRIFVLSNTIIGVGTISIAFTLKSCGLILGLILLFVSAYLSYYSLSLLIRCKLMTGIGGYTELASHTLGKKFKWIVPFTLFIYTFGAIAGYFTFLGDSLPPLIHKWGDNSLSAHSIWFNREFLITLTVVLIISPLAFVRQITKLGFTSLISLCATIFVVVAVVIQSISRMTDKKVDLAIENGEVVYFQFSTQILLALPITTFAFVCQVNLFSVIQNIMGKSEGKGQGLVLKRDVSDQHQKAKSRRMKIIAFGAIVTASFIYIGISIFGYLQFRGKTQGDLLKNYSSTNNIADSARIAMSLAIILCSPVYFFACRKAFRDTFFPKWEFVGKKFVFLTIVPLIISLGVCLLVKNIVVIFDLTSAIAGNVVVFILPGYFYIKIKNNPHLQLSTNITESSRDYEELSETDSRDDQKNGKLDSGSIKDLITTSEEDEQSLLIQKTKSQKKLKKNQSKWVYFKKNWNSILMIAFGTISGVACTTKSILSIAGVDI
ncbi:amino acid transporter [Anaeramoeba flamelloides]|uniref:Amino acid transporter n=1 Tax=Anaeramoeba flamelloides TaxID=1746091 RepID=A0ABQ8YWJ5_9EUKA|nr:amino acid transporter [Anaeramoeba flamelloides]